MKKHVFGRQLNRDTNERKALFKGLINELVMRESIQTTEAKAKAIRGEVEKLITKAKRKGGASKSLLQPWLQKDALEKVMTDLSVRFAKRPGGYTRVITLGERFGDNATMAVIEFVEKKEPESRSKSQESSKKQTGKDKVQSEVKTAAKKEVKTEEKKKAPAKKAAKKETK